MIKFFEDININIVKANLNDIIKGQHLNEKELTIFVEWLQTNKDVVPFTDKLLRHYMYEFLDIRTLEPWDYRKKYTIKLRKNNKLTLIKGGLKWVTLKNNI